VAVGDGLEDVPHVPRSRRSPGRVERCGAEC
jgi:hypothetical protein